MKYIHRPTYTDKIKPFVGKQIIKILTGQRRVGKSYVLYQMVDRLHQREISECEYFIYQPGI